jgi:hypothetical protein
MLIWILVFCFDMRNSCPNFVHTCRLHSVYGKSYFEFHWTQSKSVAEQLYMSQKNCQQIHVKLVCWAIALTEVISGRGGGEQRLVTISTLAHY